MLRLLAAREFRSNPEPTDLDVFQPIILQSYYAEPLKAGCVFICLPNTPTPFTSAIRRQVTPVMTEFIMQQRGSFSPSSPLSVSRKGGGAALFLLF